jgi:hypothetical protein
MEATNKTTQGSESAQDSAPTLHQRMQLAHAYQKQAMARPHPLAANLGTIAGDLMSMAHVMAPDLQTQLAQPAGSEETRRRSLASLELYLKVVRQSDRLVQLERQLGSTSSDRPQTS